MILNHLKQNVLTILRVVFLIATLGTSSAHALENLSHPVNVSINQSAGQNQLDKEQQLSESNSCTAYFKETLNANNCRAGEVPLPAARWLFLLALVAFVGLSNKRKI